LIAVTAKERVYTCFDSLHEEKTGSDEFDEFFDDTAAF